MFVDIDNHRTYDSVKKKETTNKATMKYKDGSKKNTIECLEHVKISKKEIIYWSGLFPPGRRGALVSKLSISPLLTGGSVSTSSVTPRNLVRTRRWELVLKLSISPRLPGAPVSTSSVSHRNLVRKRTRRWALVSRLSISTRQVNVTKRRQRLNMSKQ